MAMDGHRERQPHFVLVPLMAQGHTIPMVDLALLLAERGVLVSFITTPFNASRIKDTVRRAQDSRLPIRFVELHFPCQEAGLPEGCENIDVLPAPELLLNFFEATRLLQQPLEQYLSEPQQPYPSVIISDFCHPWTRKIARRLRVPRLTFFSVCCFTLLCHFNISHDKVYDRIADDDEPFVVPGLTEKIEVTKSQAPGFFPRPFFGEMSNDVEDAEVTADGIVVNSFEGLEKSYIEGYQKAMGKKVWTVGPLSLNNRSMTDLALRGDKASIDASRCLSWLDTMKPRSVLYVCFGSLARLEPSQAMEIGLGLEASNHPFVWAIKASEESEERVEEWLSGGFQERVSSRALIVKGWAPQAMILSHPAIGGFMTHCGWNSTLEGVTAGVPMVTWPHFADQFLNERMVVDVLKVGVSVGVKRPSFLTFDQQSRLPVRRDDVERCVRSLMDEGRNGEERRKRAKELGEKAEAAMKQAGSSYSNITHLIECFSTSA
ncbi:UDP-glycosyltransferase 73C4-like [Musa acuminata AAA Group]|uniref:UDP-glycosyltransferase 73C4-like n=1 Tax=Musa acuminata AAA Group TaxID=214697 RepID=UPI0031DC9216